MTSRSRRQSLMGDQPLAAKRPKPDATTRLDGSIAKDMTDGNGSIAERVDDFEMEPKAAADVAAVDDESNAPAADVAAVDDESNAPAVDVAAADDESNAPAVDVAVADESNAPAVDVAVAADVSNANADAAVAADESNAPIAAADADVASEFLHDAQQLPEDWGNLSESDRRSIEAVAADTIPRIDQSMVKLVRSMLTNLEALVSMPTSPTLLRRNVDLLQEVAKRSRMLLTADSERKFPRWDGLEFGADGASQKPSGDQQQDDAAEQQPDAAPTPLPRRGAPVPAPFDAALVSSQPVDLATLMHCQLHTLRTVIQEQLVIVQRAHNAAAAAAAAARQ